MRKLASIQIVKSASPIEGADAIEKLEILGWELVSKKGEILPGFLCVYVEIDSVLPERPEFEFMRPRKFKVKTIKLRGQISQGIAFPLSIIKLAHPDFDLSTLVEDQDVTELLGITKWDPEQESLVEEKEPVFNDKNHLLRLYKKYKYLTTKRVKKILGMPTKTSGDEFPSYVPKTDETRVQTMHRGLDMHQGKVAYITEKLEGSSTTFVAIKSKGNFLKRLLTKQPMKFVVCSRNKIVNNRVDPRWAVAKKYDLENKLCSLKRNIALQGELIGTRIQGNIYNLSEVDYKLYLGYDIDQSRYLTYNELLAMVKSVGIEMVPVLEENHIVHTDIKAYVELSKGDSKLNSNQRREGIVIRLKDENFSFKSINPEYLLNQKD